MDIVLSIMALATIALVAGAIYLLRRGGARKQGLLMLVLAAVFALNIAIWTVPDEDGRAPITASEDGPG